jgi:hypothetical protein
MFCSRRWDLVHRFERLLDHKLVGHRVVDAVHRAVGAALEFVTMAFLLMYLYMRLFDKIGQLLDHVVSPVWAAGQAARSLLNIGSIPEAIDYFGYAGRFFDESTGVGDVKSRCFNNQVDYSSAKFSLLAAYLIVIALYVAWAFLLGPLAFVLSVEALLYCRLLYGALRRHRSRYGRTQLGECDDCRGGGVYVRNPLRFGLLCRTCRGSGQSASPAARPLNRSMLKAAWPALLLIIVIIQSNILHI